jgi:uncharacterized membrane protein
VNLSAPLIAPEQTLTLLAILLAFVYIGLWADRQPWSSKFPGVLITILGPFLLATLGIIPHDAPLYKTFFEYLLPISIPLLLFSADLRQLVGEIGRTGLAFLVVVVSTVLSLTLLLLLFDFEEFGGIIAASQSAGLIGGSINVLSTLDILEVPSESALRVTTIASFMVGASIFMFVLFAVPSFTRLIKVFGFTQDQGMHETESKSSNLDIHSPITVMDLARLLALAAGVVVLSHLLLEILEWLINSYTEHGNEIELSRYRLLAVTAVTLAFASSGNWVKPYTKNAFPIGTFVMYLYLAVIGPYADLNTVINEAPKQFTYVLTACFLQLFIALCLARVLRLHLSELMVAMMACVTSQGAAVAIAVARGWRGLVVPAVLAGLLGYASGTFVAILFYQFLVRFFNL